MALDNLGYLIFLVCQTRPGLIAVTWTGARQMPHQYSKYMCLPKRPILSSASLDTGSIILVHWTMGGPCHYGQPGSELGRSQVSGW